MNLYVYKLKATWNRVSYEEILLDCVGSGNEEDPAIIEPSEYLPDSFSIFNSNTFINIRNCIKRFIGFKLSQNISLKDCKINNCLVDNSSKINIKNVIIDNYLKVHSSDHIYITDSNIKKLKLKQASSNIIKNCNIQKIKEIKGFSNTFQDIKSM